MIIQIVQNDILQKGGFSGCLKGSKKCFTANLFLCIIWVFMKSYGKAEWEIRLERGQICRR